MLWLVLTSAHASDVDLFDPAATLPAGRGTLQGEAPLPGQTGGTFGVLASFSSDPVVRRFEDGKVASAVDALVPLVLQGGYAWKNRVRFDAVLPVYAWIDAPIADFAGAAVGDLRVQSTVRLWRTRHMAAAIIPRLTLPTGNRSALVGGGVAGSLLASLGGVDDRFGWLLNGGVHLASADAIEPASAPLGSRVEGLVGGWWQPADTLRLGAELDVDLGIATGGTSNRTGGAHVFAQHVLPSGIGLLAGAGSGLIAGIGTPNYRVLVGTSWSASRRDADADRITDSGDVCPLQAEDPDGFADEDGCPERDNDQDGIADASDGCALEPEDQDGTEDTDGCPDPDNDGDGLVDTADSCPDTAGAEADLGCPDLDGDGLVRGDTCPDVAGPPETEGCPDADGDRVPDDRDRCPEDKGPTDEDPATSDGCPKQVYLTAKEVRIGQRVAFETGKSEVSQASNALLDEVARVILASPGIDRVEVQGHTDSVGSNDVNQALSHARAVQVVAYLVAAGVPERMLVAKGYGEDRPLFTNRTPRGRDGNRRVQFVIVPTAPAALAESPGSAAPPAVAVPAGSAAPPAAGAPPETSAAIVSPPAAAPSGGRAARVRLAGVETTTPGLLTVKVYGGEWATVFLDGQRLVKSAPFTAQEVASGTHLLRAENPRLKLGWEQTVTIAPGEELTIIVPLPETKPAPP